MRWLRRWWLIPLGALLGLLFKGLLLAAFASGGVSSAVGDVLPAGVAYDGISGVSGLGGDGANIVLRGPAGEEAAAVAAAKGLDEVNSVEYIAEGDPVVEEEEVVEEPEPDPEPAAPDLKPAQVTAAAAGTAIVLDGVVADDATKAALNAEAEAQYDEVTDNLTVDAEAFTNDGGQIVLTGEAASQTERDDWFGKGTAVAEQGNLEVIDQITIKPVDETLNDIFALEPIQFDTNLATIRPESQSTLDAAADVLNNNPEAGNLLAVGHTDSRGSDAANKALSQARADAVVAYLVDEKGVDASRLSAEGRGEDELKVDPEESDEDLQANRRIEWEVAS